MIQFNRLTLNEFLLVRDVVIAARCHLQYGRDMGKTLCIADIERAERALAKVSIPLRVAESTTMPVLEEEHTREGIQLCPKIS